MNYRIVPLVLLKYSAEKSMMTHLMNVGRPIIRPFILWYIEGGGKNILVDTAIEKKDYTNIHPDFKNLEMDHVMGFEEALRSVNLTPQKIDIIIQTHLHFDHCANTRKCTNAKVFVQKIELDIAQSYGPFMNLYKEEFLNGLDFEVINGDYKLLDGIELIHVPGHSLGCQAVSVQTERGKAVISGFCTIRENFFPEKTHPFIGGSIILPGIFMDGVKAYESILKVKKMADIVLPLHDPEIMKVKEIP